MKAETGHPRPMLALPLLLVLVSSCTRPSPSSHQVPDAQAAPAALPVEVITTPDRGPPIPVFAMPSAAGPHEWRLIEDKHWQIVSPPGEDTRVTDDTENNRGACGPGMIDVRGSMKSASMMDERQQAVCTKWISRVFPERCAEFSRDKWLAASRDLPTKPMHFCIDRFEYPNKRGEFPIILVNWLEAKDMCAASGKRLCNEAEWTFACEGEEATPYPYGYVRDAEACVVDHPWIPFDPNALGRRTAEAAKNELNRLWQGEPSGLRPHCKSTFGVYDMIGNVDEWTSATSPGRPSILKGGYWGPVRTRCRPATRAHGEAHVFYQQGFRCCADTP